MEQAKARTRMAGNMRNMRDHAVILNRRFLDDEQLIRSEQLAVLEEIFNTNVRDREMREISCHFAPVLRRDHPYHLALWGKTGTGKTLTMIYFLNFLAEMCRKEGISLRYVHLDLTTARPCFRALNDLACLLNASKRYRRGISLEELMGRIEVALEPYDGYLILFIDEVDNVRRDKDTFLAFLVRRLPQQIRAKLILVFASNRLGWSDHLDPRTKSFLKLNELVFKPYDAIDLQRILEIRVRKALRPQAVETGVVEKIAALASREHGDARKAVALLARSAHLAEKAGCSISVETVDEAAQQIEQDKYTTMIRTAPVQLQAALAGIIEGVRARRVDLLGSGEAYDAYRAFCTRVSLKPLTGRAFGDLVAELDMYSFLRARVESRGRYGRTREICFDVPDDLVSKIYDTIVLNFGVQGQAPGRNSR
jgi:cell division control protein 6